MHGVGKRDQTCTGLKYGILASDYRRESLADDECVAENQGHDDNTHSTGTGIAKIVSDGCKTTKCSMLVGLMASTPKLSVKRFLGVDA